MANVTDCGCSKTNFCLFDFAKSFVNIKTENIHPKKGLQIGELDHKAQNTTNWAIIHAHGPVIDKFPVPKTDNADAEVCQK